MAKKILVVDDEADFLRTVRLRLEAHQYHVVTASDGEEGLQKVESERPDLIVLDIRMPKMDGLTFVKQLKKNQAGRPIPVMILTAYGEMEDLFRVEGVSDYLLKPFKAEELIERIEKHLK